MLTRSIDRDAPFEGRRKKDEEKDEGTPYRSTKPVHEREDGIGAEERY